MGFFDLSNRYASLDAKNDPLFMMDAIVHQEEFRPVPERAWRKSRAWRKPMDAVVILKAPAQAGTVVSLQSTVIWRGRAISRGAAILPVPQNHNTREENKAIKNGEASEDQTDAAYRFVETEAQLRAWMLKNHIHRKGKRSRGAMP